MPVPLQPSSLLFRFLDGAIDVRYHSRSEWVDKPFRFSFDDIDNQYYAMREGQRFGSRIPNDETKHNIYGE
jgi:hypothetical protein